VQISNKKGLNANQLKLIAIVSMTIDHFVSVVFPNYPTSWWIIALHIAGRLAAPIMWFFYLYYPLHLVVCGIVRILLYGNIGVMIGAWIFVTKSETMPRMQG